MATTPEKKLFGRGPAQPFAATTGGSLKMSEGEQRLWECVNEILDTPRGSRPMNPDFGVPPLVFEVVTDVRVVAWAVGRAIEASEPRARDITIGVRAVTPEGTIYLDVAITPIGLSTPYNKIFPVYRKAE